MQEVSIPKYPGVAGSTAPPTAAGPFASALSPGASVFLFGLPVTTPPIISDSNVTPEAVAVGEASAAACIDTGGVRTGPPSVGVELQFSGAPGAFEVDVQEADTDADAFYVTPTNATYQITAVNAATQIARADLSPTGGKFIRLYVKALANPVNLRAKLTRLA